MKIYTAHLRAGRVPVLVTEGFTWGALLFGPLWLLWHRAWVVALLSLVPLGLALLAPPAWRPVLSFGVLLLLGFSGRDLVRWSLARRGYALAHVVAGRGRDDALLRLMDNDPAARQAA